MKEINHMTYYHLTEKSENVKTGPIPVSTTSADTCPPSCPMKAACYAKFGPLIFHWKALSEGRRGTDIKTFTMKLKALPEGQLWRHDQAGDLPGKGDRISQRDLSKIVRAQSGRRGFTYTHKPVESSRWAENNQKAILEANTAGFTVNLSANNLAQADRYAGLNIAPVVVVLPKDATERTFTPAGRKVITCPAQTRDGITCATCGLCQRKDRSVIIGFRAHGTAAKKASAIAVA